MMVYDDQVVHTFLVEEVGTKHLSEVVWELMKGRCHLFIGCHDSFKVKISWVMLSQTIVASALEIKDTMP